MNGLGRNKAKKSKQQSIVTGETFGVVLVLFATLATVCLITRETVFYDFGRWVNAFLFGCFGKFAYAVMAWVILRGVLLIVGKKIRVPVWKKLTATLLFFLVALLTQIISMRTFSGEYSEYLSSCYHMAEGGFSAACAGGVVMGLVAYHIPLLLTHVGSYVILGLCIAATLCLLFKNLFKKKEKGEEDPKFRGSFIKKPKEDPEKEEPKEEPISQQQPVQQPVQTTPVVQTTVQPQPQVEQAKPKVKQRLFVSNPQDFATLTKRQIAKKKQDAYIKLGFAENGLGVVSSDVNIQKTFESGDMKSKIDYIKTPVSIGVDNINNINTRVYNPTMAHKEMRSSGNWPRNDVGAPEVKVSDYIPKTTDYNTSESPIMDIPHLEHESPAYNEDVRERAEDFGRRYANVGEHEIPSRTEEQSNTFSGIARSGAVEQPQEEKTEQIPPFIEEVDGTRLSSERRARIMGGETESAKEDTEEKPPVSEILDSERVRNIFLGSEEKKEPAEEKPQEEIGFTSRVSADNNLGSRRRVFDAPVEKVEQAPVEEQEKPKEEKPKAPINRRYNRPPLDLLEMHKPPVDAPQEDHQGRMETIQKTLAEVRIEVDPRSYVQGPSVTRYEMFLPDAAHLGRVPGYADSLKMRLRAEDNIRIEAPIPGKDLIGIEVANKVRTPVGLRDVMEGMAKNKKGGSLMFALGKDVVGNPVGDDLAKGPHYLIAGATGSGKSVCLHVMICSLLMRYSPEELKLVLVDPKLNEFNKYEHIPHLLVDEIVTDTKRAITLLQWAYEETTRRNETFAATSGMVSNIDEYNSLIANQTTPKLPRIVFFIDELADLMEANKKELEEKIRKVAAKSRSAGIHLVLATQRPSVDVVTGTIKTNLPSRIGLKLMNFADSQTILSKGGAEKLLGNGDMLYQNSKMSDAVRYQGAYLTNREIMNIVNYIKENNKAYFDDDVLAYLEENTKEKVEESKASSSDDGDRSDEVNELFLQALWLAVSTKTISISQLQRRYQIGYAKAGGLVDKMERMGFVSGNEGSKARRVLIDKEGYESRFGPAPESF